MKQLFKEHRFWIIVGFKIAVIAASLLLAYLFRFDFAFTRVPWSHYLQFLPFLIAIKLAIFWWQGTFRGWWRYVSIADVVDLGRANFFASIAFILYVVFIHRLDGIPRSVLFLDGFICFSMMAGARFLTRAVRENYLPMQTQRRNQTLRTLIIGAGFAGQAIAKEIRQNPDLPHKVVGFIDDDPEKKGRRFAGFSVLGNHDQLEELVRRTRAEELIIAIPSATGMQIQDIVGHCKDLGLRFKTLPGMGDLIDGRVTIKQVRDVSLDDLLGREVAHLEVNRIRAFLEGKRVLVTGAAGSIGSEICRQVARFNPHSLVLFDHAESPLFAIHNEMGESYPGLHLTAIVGDVRDRARVERVFDEAQPQVVFHAAAYKHVPLMEHNPAEAANNNVRGTRVVADTAHAAKVESFVMISTDKAVNPTNVMGATKRAAELYVQSLARRSSTHFVTVRFGNVLGSAGSVVPTFTRQIAAGGPVTVTHPEITRFFMTIPEATQLVLQAGSMGQGGEIFLLDMGAPVKIVTLAEELIRLSGFIPYEDIQIKFTGLRPGEKLYEELLIEGEGIKPTSHEKIMVAEATLIDPLILEKQLEELYQLQRDLDLPGILAKLREIVPEFKPENGGASAHNGKGPKVYVSADTENEEVHQGLKA
ncbi:polysaccharide biosynthesis protein [Geopsychrobacter electrodiphilus]|uniref:polysaccharide biosynthesis protein n=1 Tax=Geopsychrobacter electrodiphilus TaxID=225196 RepID=UPI000477AAAE|nr:nucleoside-diphosphate sugar epimerase/dehydratase [Geopsychrobacter electrodiphilus]